MFWDMQSVLVDFLPKESTVNSKTYIKTLKKLKYFMQRAHPKVLLLAQ